MYVFFNEVSVQIFCSFFKITFVFTHDSMHEQACGRARGRKGREEQNTSDRVWSPEDTCPPVFQPLESWVFVHMLNMFQGQNFELWLPHGIWHLLNCALLLCHGAVPLLLIFKLGYLFSHCWVLRIFGVHFGYQFFIRAVPNFLAPGTGLMKDSLFMDQVKEADFRTIRVHYINCTCYFFYHYIVIYNECPYSEIIIQPTLMQNQWGTWACFPATRWSHLRAPVRI